jgi:hypothetical protein
VKAAFLYSEALLAKQIGLSRTKSRALRERLEEGVDWEKNPGGEVLLAEEGIQRIIDFTKSAAIVNRELCLAEKNGAPDHKKIMRVVPPMPMNPRVVLAEDMDGKRLLVWVGRNATFSFGDEIEVQPHPVQSGILQLVSPIPRLRRRTR